MPLIRCPPDLVIIIKILHTLEKSDIVYIIPLHGVKIIQNKNFTYVIKKKDHSIRCSILTPEK